MTNVTPWSVSGNVDYEKVLTEFGVSKISASLKTRILKICEKKGFEPHRLIKRDIIVGHRDLDKFLDAWENGEDVFLYTGRSPSAGVHLGHYLVWEFTAWLQRLLNCDLWFQFPDEEKYLFKQEYSLETARESLEDNLKEVAAMNFLEDRTYFLVNTRNANLVYPEAIKVAKKLTASSVKAAFGFSDSANVGSLFYTSMQSVPAFLPSALKGKKMHCLIPHAIDQDPHFRLTRDVLKRMGYTKPSSIQTSFLPGLKGFSDAGKMSSSNESSSVYLHDTASNIKKTINKYAFSGGQDSVELHRKKGGDPSIDVACQWLNFLCDDDDLVNDVWLRYRKGLLLSGEVKKIAIEFVQDLVSQHQKSKGKSDVQNYLIDETKLINGGYKSK